MRDVRERQGEKEDGSSGEEEVGGEKKVKVMETVCFIL